MNLRWILDICSNIRESWLRTELADNAPTAAAAANFVNAIV